MSQSYGFFTIVLCNIIISYGKQNSVHNQLHTLETEADRDYAIVT